MCVCVLSVINKVFRCVIRAHELRPSALINWLRSGLDKKTKTKTKKKPVGRLGFYSLGLGSGLDRYLQPELPSTRDKLSELGEMIG